MKKIYLLLFSFFIFTGQAVWSQCNNTAQFGTVTAPTNNIPVTITTCAFAGEYSTINGCVAGSTYLFSATGGAGNYLTIRQGTPGGTVLGFGFSPVSVVCTVSGPLYLHYNTNAACGTDFSCHTGVVQCTSCSGPPPITNDLCSGAIPINCAQTISGTTVGATIDAVATCVTTLNTAPGVWYTFVGNGVSNTLSLCGSAYDTKIGVFSGTCAGLVCVTGNDDFCGLGSQVTFTPVNGTTYYVLVTGFGAATGSFTLARTCATPANDLCTGALPINCGQTISGSTSGANPDAVATCVTTLNTAPGVWYSFAGDGFSTTLSLCGSGYDTKIGVFSGTCAGLVCVTGNDDFCSLQSQVTFTSVVGTNYFVLVTGFSTNSGAFTLARTCVLPPCLPTTITPAAPTICEGAIQQLTASSSNPGNPPAIWTPVTELYSNAAATIPYVAGTPLSTVYARPSVTRTYTANLFSVVCAPIPATVTVTVNPNPSIVIVADPGTTICQGDPTLLTVVTGTATPVGTLYTQGTTPVNGSPSQVFEPANAAFSSQAADDFTVPAGATWSVTQLGFGGIGTGTPTSVNVFFYANTAGNLPGAAIASYNNLLTFVRTGGNYVVTLPAAFNLTGGTYWVSFQVNMSFATGGQWFWGNFGAANIGNEYAWQNPGGGFATPCTNWGYGGTGCNVGGGPANRNNIFTITGTSIVGGAPLPGGYTFLWTPAAGLSSTTSNPVAASPFNTTTYTVTATTNLGCTRQASTLITVNQRPTVTTHPASRANCVGTTATFTVVGTGTALTYQWQESATGCAGPWTNIANGGIYSGATTATLTVNPVTGLMSGYAYRCILGGTCAPVNNANISNCAVLTVNANPVVAITPAISCGGVAGMFGTQLSVGSAPPPVPGSVTVNSGTLNLAVPDNTANGVSNNITMAGVPANATITNVSVTLNMSHTYPGDMIFHLRAPNGQILNLYKYGSGLFTGPASGVPTWGWYGARVSQLGSTAWSTVAVAPFIYNNSTNWRADAINTPVAGPVVQNPTGFISAATGFADLYTTPASTGGTWTLAMADGGPGDIGILASWGLTIEYTTPGTGSSTNTYVWSPLGGLYNDPQATSPYTGTNAIVVYAAPTAFTAYTVTATNTVTGCVSSSTAFVNYTPPPPAVTPTSVTMCLGDPAVRLTSSSSTTTTGTVTASSGTISVPIPDGSGVAAISTLNIAGVPAGATIAEVKITMNINHTWVGDVDVNIKAPNNAVLNLVGGLNGGTGGNATDDFTNTAFSSIGVTSISGAPAPRTGTFAAEARAGYGPTGYIQTVTNWAGLTPTSASANGVWTLAMGDWVGADAGTLTSWSIDITHAITVGVPSTRATWSPLFGLFNDAAASIPYTGDLRDTVWTRPTPSGVYPYQVTVQSLPVPPLGFTNPAPVSIPVGGTATPYPSNLTVSGLPATGVTIRNVILNGMNHTWAEDVDVLLQSPGGQNVILMSDVGGIVPISATYTFADSGPAMSITGANPTGTYRPTNNGATDNFPAPGPGNITQAAPAISMFTGNYNGVWKLFALDDDGIGDQGNISGGYTINFDLAVPACTSPARTVIVTVNQPTTVTTQPVNQTICTDKVATFSVVAAGSGPFSYQWQVSTNTGNTWANISNGGVYSGVTTTTLTITAPPVTMSGYFYRCVITGAAPCAPAISFQVVLTVNPLPTIVIAANPYTSLFPGLITSLTSTVTPSAASSYTWLRNGAAVPGAITGTLSVDVDGLGDYQLRVTDVNNCTNVSNIITIKDSVNGKCFIYPNPTSGIFQVRYYSVANNNSLPRSLTVYDAKGDRVFTQMYTIGRPYDRRDVDMRAYGKGLYWVEIGDRNGNRLTMCRVVIQ